MQFDKVKTFLDDIKANGQKIVLGGDIDERQPGNFIPVTIVDNPPEDAELCRKSSSARLSQ